MKPSKEGTIFQVQRWSVHDGDGIRTTVFFKGCPLRCRWCANPESWQRDKDIWFFTDKCVHCGRCMNVCPTQAVFQVAGKVQFDRTKCSGCGKCASVCPTGARKLLGETVSAAELVRRLARDAVFYRESGGGVTFSGGEPFMQPEFLRELVFACKRQGIDTAVETSGFFELEPVKDIIEALDFIFIDLKVVNSQQHQSWTGTANERILANIAAISKLNQEMVVRVPLMEEVNSSEENIEALCEFLQAKTKVKGVELLTYHNLGQNKYQAIGRQSEDFTAPSEAKIALLKQKIADHGITVFDFT